MDSLRNLQMPGQETERYVACFSTKFDDLNQWRSYASPGSGYCVGFSGDSLRNLAYNYSGYLGRCVYSRTTQESIVLELLSRFLADLDNYFPYFGSGEINEGLFESRVEGFSSLFGKIAPLFKNPAFKEEAEVRLIFEPFEEGYDDVSFRAGKHSIIPYIAVESQLGDDYWVKPEKIVVKSSPHQELCIQGVKRLCTSLGLMEDIVVTSTIPFREEV